MLYQNFLINTGKKRNKVLHYFPVYEKHFGKFVNQSVVFWEIGVAGGGSLQMWKQFLGPFATIIGIDINPDCKVHEEHQVFVRIGDQSDPIFLQSVLDEFGPPDIVLDDGSHMMNHVKATFEFLYDKVKNNGVYMIEDMVTAYKDNYGGGLEHPDSIIEIAKKHIDMLNARHCNKPQDFADSTYSISFYDSIVVYDRLSWPKNGYQSVITPELAFDQQKWVESFHFPPNFSKKKILIFGAGFCGDIMKEWLHTKGMIIECFVDNNKSKQNCCKSELKIISAEESINIVDALYIIAIEDGDIQKEIFEQLLSMGISAKNIVSNINNFGAK